MNNLKEEINNFINKGFDDLESKIFDLENNIKNLKKIILDTKEEMKREMKKFKNELNISTFNLIKGKYQIYEKKMKNNINELKQNIPIIFPKEQISVIFTSLDQNIHYSVICKNTDAFGTIESLFYEKYSEYKKYKMIYICNGNRVDISKNLRENNINHSDIIVFKIQK